jgi:uncharacterized protein YegL
MHNGLTEIVFILDRSGSMSGREGDTIGGFNGFVKKQAAIGPTRLTTVLFDDQYEILHNGISADAVQLTEGEYFTRGSTALLDAIGKTIHDVKKRLKALPEADRPAKIIFIITTDGRENASQKYSYGAIKEKIKTQTKKHDWEFIFMGANIDVCKESGRLGIRRDRAMSFDASSASGIQAMFGSVAEMSMTIRGETDEE